MDRAMTNVPEHRRARHQPPADACRSEQSIFGDGLKLPVLSQDIARFQLSLLEGLLARRSLPSADAGPSSPPRPSPPHCESAASGQGLLDEFRQRPVQSLDDATDFLLVHRSLRYPRPEKVTVQPFPQNMPARATARLFYFVRLVSFPYQADTEHDGQLGLRHPGSGASPLTRELRSLSPIGHTRANTKQKSRPLARRPVLRSKAKEHRMTSNFGHPPIQTRRWQLSRSS